jgi:hypothetical protein
MAKRSRQARRSQVETAVAAVAPMTAPIAEIVRKGVNFAQEYAYVYKELRNILLIAIGMFVVMVALSYIF